MPDDKNDRLRGKIADWQFIAAILAVIIGVGVLLWSQAKTDVSPPDYMDDWVEPSGVR